MRHTLRVVQGMLCPIEVEREGRPLWPNRGEREQASENWREDRLAGRGQGAPHQGSLPRSRPGPALALGRQVSPGQDTS